MNHFFRGILYIILILASSFVAIIFWCAAIMLLKLGLLFYGTLAFLGMLLLVGALVLFIYLEETNG